jgi:hypothetical protein
MLARLLAAALTAVGEDDVATMAPVAMATAPMTARPRRCGKMDIVIGLLFRK